MNWARGLLRLWAVRSLLAVGASLTGFVANALEQKRHIPDELFGIRLGSIYEMNSAVDTVQLFPAKRPLTIETNEVPGMLIYHFEPSKKYDAFQFIEKGGLDSKSNTSSFYTSFTLQLPPDLENLKQLNEKLLRAEVLHIVWWIDASQNLDTYLWSKSLCDTFVADFLEVPKIFDYWERKIYECEFSYENRSFKVSNITGQSVSLAFESAFSKIKSNQTKDILLRLRSREILK